MVAYKTRANFSRGARASDMAEGNFVHGGKHRTFLTRKDATEILRRSPAPDRRYRFRSQFEPNSENTTY